MSAPGLPRTPGPWVLDGGLSTELEHAGLTLHPTLWSALVPITHPEVLHTTHAAFARAGADVLTACTYQASAQGFAAAGVGRDVYVRAVQRAVSIAKAAADEVARETGRPRARVVASIGPLGATLADGSEYRGDYTHDVAALIAHHTEKRAVVALGRPDMVAYETVPLVRELRAITAVLTAHAGEHPKPVVPTWVSMQLKDAWTLASGEPLTEGIALLDACPHVWGIGVNCVAPEVARDALEVLRAHTAKPLVIAANQGEGFDGVTGDWTPAPAHSDFHGVAVQALHHGAAIVGGCCRTRPAHIAQLATARTPGGDAHV